MIYWRILLADGRTGWQVMDADMNGAEVMDDEGNPLAGNIEYKVTDTASRPVWAV